MKLSEFMTSKSSILKSIVSSALLIVTIVFTIQVIILAKKNQKQKIDLSHINHIHYGLLNIDEWKEKISGIIIINIEEFEISEENQEQLQTSIENVLYTVIGEVEKLMEERTAGQFSGIKKWVAGLAIDFDQLRDSVPSISVSVLEELDNPETKEKLKGFLIEKLTDLSEMTYNMDRMEFLERLLIDYGCVDKMDCKTFLSEEISKNKDAINYRVGAILFLVLLIFLLNLISRGELIQFQASVLILASLCLLLGGIITPMIELEARIDLLLFKLLGEEVIFEDQIIFFQSKSITDVVRILMKDGAIQMIFVGLLIFVFSIVFPSLKLISSYIYFINLKNLRENKVIRFFVLKSGKWSMADVMVVALFMAYIGFNGIVSSQLDSLSNAAKSIEILSTNGTQLLGGFYLFLFFCISSLILSEAFTRRSPTTI